MSSSRATDAEALDAILLAVTDQLERGGYDEVALREVAREAHVSLARVYRLLGSREEMIVAAIANWMADRAYSDVAPPAGTGIYDGLMHVFHAVFGPWEHNPQMLEAIHRARTGPRGQALVQQGTDAIRPALRAVVDGTDDDYVKDVEMLLFNTLYAVFGRFADGDLPIAEILPTLERTAYRLTADNSVAHARP